MTTALERLASLVEPPTTPPPPADWNRAERQLGNQLPEDFKELLDTYGNGQFDEHIRIWTPDDSSTGRGLISMNDGYFDELEELWEMNEEAPEEFDEDSDATLIVWARTKDADTLNWLVRPGIPPDKWPLMVLDGDARVWERYEMPASTFLAELLAGEIDSGVLTSELTPPDHTFRPRGA